MHHVILGAGPAGVIAAETIRKHNAGDSITLIGDEPHAPYSRMAIPYWLIGHIDEAGTHLRKSATHFADQRITLLHGRADKLDIAEQTVMLADGQVVGYDRLLIATGSSPAHPPIPGIDLPGVHTCWTMDDAHHILDRAKPGARVLQMGAGFIGCIILEALQQRGVQLTVVEMGDRMVPRMMGEVAGNMIRDWCEHKGVRVHTGTRVDAIAKSTNDGDALDVKLSSGETITVDLVISATGVKPNMGFLKDSGVICLVGVLTDEHMQTNVPNVYAAGDCAEAFDKVSGKTIVSAIQPNAAEQARVAALNMVGQRSVLRGVTQINVLDTLGLISASFGQWEGIPGGQHAELTELSSADGPRHLSLQFAEDRLIGCNCVGWTDHIGVMRGLVEGKVHLGEWKDKLLQDPTQLMAAYLASAQGQGAWTGAADERRR